jgi:hypothetical protein
MAVEPSEENGYYFLDMIQKFVSPFQQGLTSKTLI